MTGQRDIDRTLDAWFVDGPSVMPDRLFDAVLDQVERTPQRPFARLRLRLTDMNPRIGWLAAAAAGVIVVIVALATINRPVDDGVGASSTPIVSPSAPAAEVPTELRSIWMGGPRPLPGLDPDAGVTLTLTASDFEMSQSAGSPEVRFASRAAAAGRDEFALITGKGATGCAEGGTGIYTWSLSASGQTLEIVAKEDPCAERLAAVPGTYWRMDCPTPDDNCLEEIDVGTYGSQFFDPFIPTGEAWSPRYGALTYTVPTGWVNYEDWPGYYRLVPERETNATGIFLASDVVVVSEEDHCVDVPASGVGETAQEIADWLPTANGLDTTSPTQATVGGLDAWWVEVSLDPAWTETCPFSEGNPVRGLFTDRAEGEGFHWTIGPDAKSRFYLVDLGDGRALLLEISGTTQAEFDGIVDEAITIIESFELAQ